MITQYARHQGLPLASQHRVLNYSVITGINEKPWDRQATPGRLNRAPCNMVVVYSYPYPCTCNPPFLEAWGPASFITTGQLSCTSRCDSSTPSGDQSTYVMEVPHLASAMTEQASNVILAIFTGIGTTFLNTLTIRHARELNCRENVQISFCAWASSN